MQTAPVHQLQTVQIEFKEVQVLCVKMFAKFNVFLKVGYTVISICAI